NRFRSVDIGTAVPLFASLFSLSVDKAIPEQNFRKLLNESAFPESRTWRQFLELVLLEDISGDWEVWELLDHAESLPLIDRYELFLRLAAVALGSRHNDGVKVGRIVSRLGKMLNDPALKYLAECIYDKSDIIP